jgi:hypothetical protein
MSYPWFTVSSKIDCELDPEQKARLRTRFFSALRVACALLAALSLGNLTAMAEPTTARLNAAGSLQI